MDDEMRKAVRLPDTAVVDDMEVSVQIDETEVECRTGKHYYRESNSFLAVLWVEQDPHRTYPLLKCGIV